MNISRKIEELEKWEVRTDEDMKILTQRIEHLEKSQESIMETIIVEELN